MASQTAKCESVKSKWTMDEGVVPTESWESRFVAFPERPVLTDKEWLAELADGLDSAVRVGEGPDVPEGTVGIWLSDTLARQIAARLRAIAWGAPGEWIRTQPEVKYETGGEGSDGQAGG